ncbi:hypothetical protein CEUSTIGMA_g470.t1 [Chlamydomonas eustigma]|uniref:Uncharacterized protein n=1 Tax=Chlamydomonas eustigma TaxID=1157962 RepID=A0A250WQB7_9CHLO|nr:hypothetical protein CEUSTIGMA_g470.t1 [Chlamydomonas eustigma]|eukprot:GAX73018.1 hypothetical protein CEUSTIGMA_g470.t1 [Chlamydomonas eustigma]
MSISNQMNRSDTKSERILQVANNLAVYTFLIGALPFTALFLSQYGYLDGLYYYTLGVPSKEHRIYYSGLFAIIIVNIVIASFITHAFSEPVEVEKKKKQ